VKCFKHRDADAVGSCKACSKGLCADCAVDVGRGLACGDTCVEQVRRVNELVERNIRMSPTSEQLLGKQSRGYLVTGGFGILAGTLVGILGQNMDGVFRVGVMGIGVLVVLSGVWHTWLGWRLRSSGKAQ
jgi:hypothetical protein